jgi:CelD/BcsL family acetyltransferase involved in cellulose biosynthesis
MAPRRLGFLSTGEAEAEETCATYLDLLHLPGAAAECLEEIQAALFDPRDVGWDELDLSRLSGRSPLVAWGATGPASYRGHAVTGSASQIADLSGGFEAYLGRLSSNSRSQARRLLRQAVEAGAELELAGDAETAERFLDELIELHQARWQAAGKPGCFAAPRFTQLHRRLVERWAPTGDAVLARLSHAGTPLAVVLGYVARGKFDYYISGTRMDEGPVRSPGIAAHLLLKRRLAEQGVTHYDYMGGSYRYKQQFATYEHPVTRLRLTRPTLRSGIHLAGSFAVRAARKAARVAARGAARPEVKK